MRTLKELIDTEKSGWPIVKEWITLAKNCVETLPILSTQQAETTLVNTQLSTRSLIGSIIYHTGGLLINKGLIRILGSGSHKMKRSFSEWNLGKTMEIYGAISPYLLIADDAFGGFYAINGGGLGSDAGNIYYNSPDCIDWLPMNMNYNQFLLFCFETDLNDFYQDISWDGWEKDIESLQPDYAYSFQPGLWTIKTGEINNTTRTVLPIEVVYNANMSMKSAAKK